MYVPKHRSELKASKADQASWQRPAEGPTIMVDDDDPVEPFCCGLSSFVPRVWHLPFPQNKVLTVESEGFHLKVIFVPVINLPLSANRYYVVSAEGDHKGQVYTCSSEENMTTCCFGRIINDVKPKPFDHRDIYQQIEIMPLKGGRGQFTAKSVALDGFPPGIFRQKRWVILYERKSKNYWSEMKYQLGDAFGVNDEIRLNFLKHDSRGSVVAGKWYCPFIFVEEGFVLRDQMERACYYEVTLTQHWRRVYYNVIENKRILLRGDTKMREESGSSDDGFVWFTTTSKTKHVFGERIGLSSALWERIVWEENREGWVDQGTNALVEVKVGSSVLVEKFSFRRLDGSVAFALEFTHTDKIRTK